uniref:NPH3 domain-containing protein n=1 Tax=Steinernema glaseri TaxID=37863 RepID=A0A1I7XX04_9BILA
MTDDMTVDHIVTKLAMDSVPLLFIRDVISLLCGSYHHNSLGGQLGSLDSRSWTRVSKEEVVAKIDDLDTFDVESGMAVRCDGWRCDGARKWRHTKRIRKGIRPNATPNTASSSSVVFLIVGRFSTLRFPRRLSDFYILSASVWSTPVSPLSST